MSNTNKFFSAIFFRATLVLVLICPEVGGAGEEKRQHGKHAHGAAEVAIAFDGLMGKLEFHSPADIVLDSEKLPKTKAEKAKVEAALAKIQANMARMVVFDSNLECKFQPESAKQESEAPNHSDVDVDMRIQCQKSPLGTWLHFNFQKFLPKLNSATVQVLVDSLQKQIEVKSGTGRLELK